MKQAIFAGGSAYTKSCNSAASNAERQAAHTSNLFQKVQRSKGWTRARVMTRPVVCWPRRGQVAPSVAVPCYTISFVRSVSARFALTSLISLDKRAAHHYCAPSNVGSREAAGTALPLCPDQSPAFHSLISQAAKYFPYFPIFPGCYPRYVRRTVMSLAFVAGL